MDELELDIIVMVDEGGNYSVGDDEDAVRERFENDFGMPTHLGTYRLKLTVHRPGAIVAEARIAAPGPVALKLVSN